MAETVIRPVFSRRGVLGAGLVGGAGLVAACSPRNVTQAQQAADAGVCLLTPEVTEGPYYFDPEVTRADIREERAGVPLRLRIRVLDASCRPMANARVGVWHCDAQGLYSGYSNQPGGISTEGEKFLRGNLTTDANGDAAFTTIYPGWYQGRTTHIHQKIYIGDRNVLTAQIFLPDALSEYIYLNAPAYARSETRDTLNAQDDIAAQQGRTMFGAVKEETDFFELSVTVGVNPEHESAEGQMPGGRPPGGEGGRPPGPPPEGGRPGSGGPGGGPRFNLLSGDERLKAMLPGE